MVLRFALSIMVGCAGMVCATDCFAQDDGFKVEKVGKQVKEFQIDSISLKSPMENFLSRTWIRLAGKPRYWYDISTSSLSFDKNAPDEVVEDYVRDYVLNEVVDCVVTYRDSVGVVVTHTPGDDTTLLNYCWIEDGKWVNAGQGLADDFENARKVVRKYLPEALRNLPRIDVINQMPKDVTPFTEFLSGVTRTPEEFLLDMLGSHKLVINGEYHRRKVSWDMLKRLIAFPEFPDKVGCVFMELTSWRQPLMDKFMESDTLDTDLILQIFRDEQLNGWWDRGEYEFLCDLWKLNHELPDDKKIRVILADYQLPYSTITKREEAKEAEDRNTHMAETIAKTIQNSEDPRNNLFLVGCGHAYKSRQPGIASAAHGKKADLTAGAQLTEMLGKDNVFTVFQHVLSGDNSGGNKAPVRGGIFDKAFELNGNRPVGFMLSGSPFGTEPFDGIYEIKYRIDTGNYEDNFDGYLFLAPLASEPKASPLTEIFTDEFVEEMKRRAEVMNLENRRWMWFGRPASELTKEYIIDILTK